MTYIIDAPFYWLVETKDWEEWTYSKSDLIKEVELAHKNKLKVRVRRFNDIKTIREKYYA